MLISTSAAATSPPATRSTSTMLPARRGDSWRTNGSRGASLSGSAVMSFRDTACRLRIWRAVCASGSECLNRAGKRKPARDIVAAISRLKCFWRGFWARFRTARTSELPPGQPSPQTHDVADDLGDRLVMFHRDLLIDLDSGVQRPCKRDVLDDRDLVRTGDFPDLEGEIVDALGDADRRRHAALVGQRHRIVGRVGDDHGGLGNRGHHPLLHALLAQLPDLALDVRVAFGLL